jgi:diadenosine tetraphosphate (Ap4A) HIT family hydrolase
MQAPRNARVLGFPGAFSQRRNPKKMAEWTLHPQLFRDTASLGDLPLSRVLVMNDANYPWLILVPRKTDITEVIDLDEGEQTQLMREATLAARALREVTECHKLNIAALGNEVPQLHVHVIARFRHDAAWPNPVWGKVTAKAYAREERDRFMAALRERIPLA